MAFAAAQRPQDSSKLPEGQGDRAAVTQDLASPLRPRQLTQRPSWIGPLKTPTKSAASGQPTMSLPVTVRFSSPGLQPPVYICSNLTEPQWEPVEMERIQTAAGENIFQKSFTVDEGEYQYKIRLGPGDWWVIDESKPTVDDGAGNKNNLVVVKSGMQSTPHDTPANDQSQTALSLPAESVHPVEAVLPSALTEAQSSSSAELTKSLTKDSRIDSIIDSYDTTWPAQELEVMESENDDDDSELPPLLHHETLTPSSEEQAAAPLLRHESFSTMYTTSDDGSPILDERPYEMLRSRKDSAPPIPEEADPNDPTLHRFPTHTEGIFEHIQNTQRRLPEDLEIPFGIDVVPVVPAVVTMVTESAKLDDLTEESEDSEDSDFEQASQGILPAMIISEGRITPPETPAREDEEDEEEGGHSIKSAEQGQVQDETSPLLKRKLSDNVVDTPTGALAAGIGIVVAVVTIVVGVFCVSGNSNNK